MKSAWRPSYDQEKGFRQRMKKFKVPEKAYLGSNH